MRGALGSIKNRKTVLTETTQNRKPRWNSIKTENRIQNLQIEDLHSLIFIKP